MTLSTQGEKFILTVKVPQKEKNAMNCAKADISLIPWRGGELFIAIPCRADSVTKPALPYNGIKVMLMYQDRNGKIQYAGGRTDIGTFSWKMVTASATIPENAVSGTILLGLQDSSGEVQFDLSGLTLDGFRPPSSYKQCSYTSRVTKTPPLRGVMSPRRFNPGDLADLQKWGANLVRVQFCRNWLKVGTDQDINDYDSWMEENLRHLELILAEAQTRGIRVIIDLHTPPGGWCQGGETRMFFEKKYADHYLETWKKIAHRFKNHPAIWGYDLLNEPVQRRNAKFDYWTIQFDAAQAIRMIDDEIPIIIESNRAASPEAFSYLKPFPLNNIIYQAHFYEPKEYTHQQVFSQYPDPFVYPGHMRNGFCGRDELRQYLEPIRKFQQRYGARIYIGEFSVAAWAHGAADYLADCITLFEEYQWDWSYHAFRESRIWSVEHVGSSREYLVQSSENARKKVLLRAFEKNRLSR